ncbi:MAG TPA: beta-glucosidase BglX [Pyrinomonadaceae bacterium]|nr:beta-glucosidase BglX [Pyrinomonadaceae bacterium]
MKKVYSILLLLCFLVGTINVLPQNNVKNLSSKDVQIEQKVNALLAKMTLAEKLGQLQQLDGDWGTGEARPEQLELARKGLLGSTLNARGFKGANDLQKAAMQSRLKIPVLLGFDVIHGYRTMFPIPLGESASWDLEAIERSAHIAAKEAKATGLHWTFAPMVDIARDPRWGRIAEGAGEDTYLGSKIAYARVRGFQGDDMSADDRIMACAKHFIGYGAAEAGRDYNTTDMSEQRLRDVYLPPFKAAVDAGVGSFMTSFNSLNGVPSTANPFLWKTILAGEWKSKALVVTDYNATKELVNHAVAADEAEAALKTLNAGVDLEMVSRAINENGEKLVKEGKLSMATIDDAVRSVLRAKFRVGAFDFKPIDANKEKAAMLTAENRQVAREIGAKSMVLLKNNNNTLPISKSVKSLAVIGFLANDKRNMNGNWAADAKEADAVTLMEGLKNKLGNGVKLNYAVGCDLKCEDTKGFDDAVKAAKNSDFVIITAGEDIDWSAEAASRSDIGLKGKQSDLIKAIHATGKPYAIVLMNGRPLTINWEAENSPAILETWFAGTEAGNAIADVLFGDVNPSGKLPVTFPRSVGQIPIYYNALPTGRPFLEKEKYTSKYLDIPNTPLFPFGYGLSYTTFNLSNMQLSETRISKNGTIKVSVDLENTGKRDGAEVVQVYIRDMAASLSRPVKELKGFQKVFLKAGEKRKIEIPIKVQDLGFYDINNRYVVEEGQFRVMVGTDSQNIKDEMSEFFTVVK